MRTKRNSSANSLVQAKRPRYDAQVVPSLDASENVEDSELASKVCLKNIPRSGTPVNRKVMKRAGPYILGPKLGNGPVESIAQYLARKENTGDYYQLKILVLNSNPGCVKSLEDEKQGKLLLHSEYQLLTMLQNEEGIIRSHELFSDIAFEEEPMAGKVSEYVYTGKLKRRIILVVDCVTAHEFCDKTSVFINLQQYLIKEKTLSENRTLLIFYEIIKIVENLHRKNVVHRDLKLSNIVYNTLTQQVIITNFCLGKHLLNENDYLRDQRGSPAYTSPDVLGASSQTPYKGKPSDIWALGVVLFTMLYSQFPFFETTPAALFKRIKSADYKIPKNSKVSEETQFLIKNMLLLNPEERLTATEIRERLEDIMNGKRQQVLQVDQVVPENSVNQEETQPKINQPDPTLSSKAFTGLLDKVLNSTTNSLLKPPNISVQRLGRDARRLTSDELGQFQGLIRNMTDSIGRNRRSSAHISLQMSNLSIRNRTDRQIAIVPRQEVHRGLQLYYNNINQTPPASGSQSTPAQGSNSTSGSVEFWNRRRSVDRLANWLSNLRTMVATRRGNPIRLDEPALRLFCAMNKMYNQGRIPAPNADALQEFSGVMTNELAEKIGEWLIADYSDLAIVRDIFGGSTINAKDKVFELLRRCGVQMEVTNGVTEINRAQTIEMLIILAYMLRASGYSNSYFRS
ncbi:serine/threonine-protein kinase dst2-like isoform X2 [Phlebotomus papatasi]|uniref:serine/threonine-protein kinase dst2-like isoform X2 n=1 Tax=Phlebotomus papatasi TaxID=29031 RepID=UPI0024843FFA|nr:serine/threonine-protein kinase dst2-like isoform X2 [Phlebotomus papatasi]